MTEKEPPLHDDSNRLLTQTRWMTEPDQLKVCLWMKAQGMNPKFVRFRDWSLDMAIFDLQQPPRSNGVSSMLVEFDQGDEEHFVLFKLKWHGPSGYEHMRPVIT